ncbi:subtype B tannase [Sporosarcina obsidiansis]|uniref:subtype B tannase n=1 Tax=Sporosarcina obsidiansis TaxID=2660748 RepID=UPI00129B5DE5|nr:subtype B tannase [Sporosarcina obsidiansis]
MKKNQLIGTSLAIFLTSSSLFSLSVDANYVQSQQLKLKEVVDLNFDSTNYTLRTVTVGGKTIAYRAYENVVYVANPVNPEFQSMNIYIPEEYFSGNSINGYTADSAPIFLPNIVGGYNQAKPADEKKDSVTQALIQGYVVASPGARGRTTEDENGKYIGKAPAAIVDLKAAVRYLRHNNENMPGDTEKIIANGTSAGGALTSLLGASGNHKDFEPYLKEIGAANNRDDIFAVSSYCPITNLEHADMAYEWLFNGINDWKWGERTGTLSKEDRKVSSELKSMFPEYVNSLELHASGQGTFLILNSDGNGSFKEYVKSFIIESAQKAIGRGTDLTAYEWLTINDGQVTDLDIDAFISYATRMKTPPAFDGLDASSWENTLFGTSKLNEQHFTFYSYSNSTNANSLADPQQVKMMNPMEYIEDSTANTSSFWRIRHGAIDRDTSLAIPIILATKLQNEGYEVDFSLPWDVGHSGDYDLDELFSWIDGIAKKSTSYSDLTKENTHIENILTATTLGFLNGYPDGTFRADQQLTRGHVIKALAKYELKRTEQTISSYDITGVSPFHDIPATYPDQELYISSLIVKKARFFDGDHEGNATPSSLINRQQMAKILVHTFQLQQTDNSTKQPDDLEIAASQYKNYIKILASHEVTTSNNFNPHDSVTRGQFATFLVRANKAGKSN